MFSKIDLPFKPEDVSEFMDTETVNIHYNKHHQGYLDKLNITVLENQPELFQYDLLEVLTRLPSMVRPEIQMAVYNNGFQVVNHNMFWESLSPNESYPSIEMMNLIVKYFGNLDIFFTQITEKAMGQFGSGWVFLTVDNSGRLSVESTSNGDNPIMLGRTPMLTIDIWEHAYYLRYQNRRNEFIAQVLKFLNWERVLEIYKSTIK